MTPVPEYRDVTPETFARDVRPQNRPAVLRGLVAHWPAVAAASAGAPQCADYLRGFALPVPVTVMHAPADIGGRFHYRADLRGFNFARGKASMAEFLDALLAEADCTPPDAMAMQSQAIPDLLPGFAEANPLALLPASVVPRLWIGNAITVATHNDPKENIACAVAGRRRFTLFPPDQLANLYVGPLEHTPAGTPISMVDPAAPDLHRYPRFAEALGHAQTAELGPGDAIYLPYHWWHHVESLDPFNMLVNYWWDDARTDIGSPWDALLQAMWSLKPLPPAQRAAWRIVFEHYVFEANGDPGAHLPDHAKGVLGEIDPAMARVLRDGVKQMLRRL